MIRDSIVLIAFGLLCLLSILVSGNRSEDIDSMNYFARVNETFERFKKTNQIQAKLTDNDIRTLLELIYSEFANDLTSLETSDTQLERNVCIQAKLVDAHDSLEKLFANGVDASKYAFLIELIDTSLEECFDLSSLSSTSMNQYRTRNSNFKLKHDNILDYTNSIELIRKKWTYAFMAGLLISLAGLICYSIMPMLNFFFNNSLQNFLIALAVGSLIGDALLHLMPQAFVDKLPIVINNQTVNQVHPMNLPGVYKGLAVIVGMYAFFLIENLMRIRRANKAGKSEQHYDVHMDNLPMNAAGSACQSAAKHDETTMTQANKEKLESYSMYDESSSLGQMDLANKYAKKEKCQISTDLNRIKFDDDDNNSDSISNSTVNETKSFRFDLVEDSLPLLPLSTGNNARESAHRHKESAQSTKTSMPGQKHCSMGGVNIDATNVKLIAWMVVMGDALHNFADGLALGASFASSLTAGLSTSLAVLFHELPHEIGDFAVLRRAGVSLRQAIFFNGFSGVLCLIGVAFGLFIGTVTLLSDWSLLFTAGVFIYISLVDMIPELWNDKEENSNLFKFVIQSFGLLTGVGIMFLIAIYHDKIMHIF